MRILFINNDGGGFADHIEVANGTTVQDLFDQQVRSGRTTHFAHAAEWVRRRWEEIDGDRFREIGIREVQGWRLA